MYASETAIFDHSSVAERRVDLIDCKNSIPDSNFLDVDGKLVGCQANQNSAHFGRSCAYRSTADLDRTAAIGVCLVRRRSGVNSGNAHAVKCDIQLFSRYLSQRCLNSLTQFALARRQGNDSVGIDAQPRIKAWVCGQRAGQTSRKSLLRNHTRRYHVEIQDDGSGALQETSARSHDVSPSW